MFEPVEADLVDEEDLWAGVELELVLQRAVGEPGEQIFEHVGGGGVAAAIVHLTSDEQEGFGEMAFAGTAGAGEDDPLFALYE